MLDVGMWGKGHGPCLSPRAAPSDLEGTGCGGEWLACVRLRGKREGTVPCQVRGFKA